MGTNPPSNRQLAHAVSLIFGELSPGGEETFEELCLEEGLLWRCEGCGWNCSLDEDKCGECGKPAWGQTEEELKEEGL